MGLLIAGLLIWSLVHLAPSLAPPLKQKLTIQLGEKVYKLLFALLIFAALALIIFGWRSTTATYWVLIAFSLLVLGYFGSKFVLEVLLQN